MNNTYLRRGSSIKFILPFLKTQKQMVFTASNPEGMCIPTSLLQMLKTPSLSNFILLEEKKIFSYHIGTPILKI